MRKPALQEPCLRFMPQKDIYTADHQKDENGNRYLEYAKDTLVATVTTDETGSAVIENLPLGKYRVEEKKAPEGYTWNAKGEEVTFTYAGQDTPGRRRRSDI